MTQPFYHLKLLTLTNKLLVLLVLHWKKGISKDRFLNHSDIYVYKSVCSVQCLCVYDFNCTERQMFLLDFCFSSGYVVFSIDDIFFRDQCNNYIYPVAPQQIYSSLIAYDSLRIGNI